MLMDSGHPTESQGKANESILGVDWNKGKDFLIIQPHDRVDVGQRIAVNYGKKQARIIFLQGEIIL